MGFTYKYLVTELQNKITDWVVEMLQDLKNDSWVCWKVKIILKLTGRVWIIGKFVYLCKTNTSPVYRDTIFLCQTWSFKWPFLYNYLLNNRLGFGVTAQGNCTWNCCQNRISSKLVIFIENLKCNALRKGEMQHLSCDK